MWTLPRVLRGFLRHRRELFAELGRLLYGLLCRYFRQAARRTIRTAMVSSHQTFGEFASWHPHWHSIVLEGGFDHDRFFFIPIGAGAELCETWRRRVVALFLNKVLLNKEFARMLAMVYEVEVWACPVCGGRMCSPGDSRMHEGKGRGPPCE